MSESRGKPTRIPPQTPNPTSVPRPGIIPPRPPAETPRAVPPPAQPSSVPLPGAKSSSGAPAATPLKTVDYASPPQPTFKGTPKLSLVALLGAIWAPLFFVMLILSAVELNIQPGQAAPAWQQPVQLVLIPLGWAAPFATTVLGLLALGQIQRSNGATYGLSLALFDSLLFPLLLIDALVFWFCWQVHAAVADSLPPVVFRQAVPTIVCVLGDYFLVLRAWAAVQPEAPAARPRR